MTAAIVIAGTDTNVGKTVFAAALAGALGASYWKPVQAGLDGETDSQTVARLGNLAPHRVLPEAYRLATPASPHYAASIDGVAIDIERLEPPPVEGPLVIELAGGLLVPLAPNILQIDLLSRWRVPVVLVAATRLGTINHTLLSIEALKARHASILGVAFVGDAAPASMQAVADFGGVRVLGRLPHMAGLSAERLQAAFAENFSLGTFVGPRWECR